MKSKTIFKTPEETGNEENGVNQVAGLSKEDVAKFNKKMDRLHEYLEGLAEKANHSEEVCQMIQQGLMDVMDWFIPIR